MNLEHQSPEADPISPEVARSKPDDEPAAGQTQRHYWRSLQQWAELARWDSQPQQERGGTAEAWAEPVSRRHFVKLMSASLLLAGFGCTGCRRPEEPILPFSTQPPGYVHGLSQYYATAMPTQTGAVPLLVKVHEGRPIKIEGNPLHPDSNGGTDLFAQASILNLYDPDRVTQFKHAGQPVSRTEALDTLADLAKQFAANQGAGLAVLLQRSSSPSRERLIRALRARLPRAGWYVYDPVDFSRAELAARLAFGRPVRPYCRLDQARVIVALDWDFLGTEDNQHVAIRQFAQGRRLLKPTDPMNRLYVVESLLTLTGAQADHRLVLPPSAIIQAAAFLCDRLLGPAGAPLLSALRQAGPVSDQAAAWLAGCAADLLKPEHRGHSLVFAGHRQPLAVHLAAQAINAALGNIGQTVVYHAAAAEPFETLAQLRQALDAGAVQTLVILGGNPVYDAPADFDWGRTQRKAKTVLRLGYYEDETSAAADWLLPQAHYLEAWGDARTSDGTLLPVQPVIQPLFGGLSELEVLARLGALEPVDPYHIVRATFRELVGAAQSEELWKRFLHDGFLPGSAAKPEPVQFDFIAAARATEVTAEPPPSKDALEVVFSRDLKVDDGRYNNNGWLQELPDPITKLTWDNAILISPATAQALGLPRLQPAGPDWRVPVVQVTVADRTLTGPAWVQPGMADFVLGLTLGYGRSRTGRVGQGTGYNAYALRSWAAPNFVPGAKLKLTTQTYQLACTQSHGALEGRGAVREANREEYQRQPNLALELDHPAAHGPGLAHGQRRPLYPNPLDQPGPDGRTPRQRALHAWGMCIDLTACVGCGACVIACQSENNIPIVGKDQVARGREMHWLRLDRYYATGPAASQPQALAQVQVIHQPMLCQHCEAAPCESVCPFNATVHDEEGLNVMAYNRCVGTRYCSNNCPYKVRRFNYLDYHRRPLYLLRGPVYASPLVHRTEGQWDLSRWWRHPDGSLRPKTEWELLKLVQNPDVTVRMRGVMEKCTFCTQRIEQAKIANKMGAGPSKAGPLPDGAVLTACQQACPAGAIVFGNLKDPNSHVAQLKRQGRNYVVLEWLLTQPRVSYLARIRNPNPAMPDYVLPPLSRLEPEASGRQPSAES